MESFARRTLPFACFALAIIAATIWWQVYRLESPHALVVSFLNVGQGDAIFIESPTGRQVLIDGGPDASVLRELGGSMAWYDRHIDVVMATHPDADHIAGLVDVLQRYSVDYIFTNGATKNTGPAESLLLSVAHEGARELVARRGEVLDLGAGVRLTVLYPDRDVSQFKDTNDGSMVARLTYGDTAFLLTGDATQPVEDYLVYLDHEGLKSDVLKPGHHGSKTSSAPDFIGFVDPQYAVLSRGCTNRYGHPHAITLQTLARFKVTTLDTCKDGRVVFESDGKTVVRK
jgi:competence protein ComEC